MNNNYYQKALYPTENNNPFEGNRINQIQEQPVEENNNIKILKLNRGKFAKIFVSFTDSNEWHDKIFEGIIEQVGRDHIIISDPKTGKWTLISIIYMNYLEFDEEMKLPLEK